MDQALALAQFLADTAYTTLPSEAIQAGQRGLLDCLGTAISGAQSDAAHMALELIEESGGRPQATLISVGRQAPLRDAALFNGTAGHALDYDDTLSVPAAMTGLALAEYHALSGRELVRAYVLGFEVAQRMTKAIGGWENARGWHMMGVAGVFGAATAAALLLKLEPPQIAAALGIAASQAAGLVAMHGFLTKPFHAGKAAANGLFAAQLAMRGCTTGPALEGALSVSQAMGGTPNPDLAGGLGRSYAIMDNRLKPFPCGRLGHAAIEAALKARTAHGITPEEIVSVKVHVEPHAQYLMGKSEPANGTQSMFSIGHAVAAGLARGRVGPAEFSDQAVRDDGIVALRCLTEVIADKDCKPGQARIAVRTKSRDVVDAEVPVQKGYAANPLTNEDVREKFLSLVEPVLGAARAHNVVELVYRLDAVADAGEIARVCA
jgi:2-methylcitrate dehydratase PrpD